MIVGGVGSNSVTIVPDASTAPAQAPQALAQTGGGAAARPAPVAADAFVPPSNPRIALPELGDAGAPKSAAYHDYAEARAELRHAKNEKPGNGHRRADIREAKRDLHKAENALQAEAAGGGAAVAVQDKWQGAPGTAGARGIANLGDKVVDPGEPTVADQQIAIANGGAPLELGHELPEINQLKPKGNDGNYYNGDMNCAPAALAMVARGNPNAMLDGKPVGHYPDAALVNRIGEHANTNVQGTAPNALIDTAEEMGFQTSTKMGGLNSNFYDQALQQGGSIIANGAYYIGDELAGHFVTVTAKAQDGNYVVNDPLQGRLEWTPNQLDLFLRANPSNGGVSIACV